MANQITPNPSVPSQVVAEVKFPKFINNLGIIPTSYKDSMSYYECLAWLCKFLEETVIPTVNENGEAVQELQNLYIELNSYVTHYFETLDVQEEINNKLDDMVEDGTLQEIVADYLNAKALFGYDTVADMKEATNLINGSFAKTLGYYEKNDGGSGVYKITNIEPSGFYEELDSGLYAELIENLEKVECYGISSENEDNIQYISRINHLDKIEFSEGKTYNFSETFTLYNKIIKGNLAKLVYTGTNGISTFINFDGQASPNVSQSGKIIVSDLIIDGNSLADSNVKITNSYGYYIEKINCINSIKNGFICESGTNGTLINCYARNVVDSSVTDSVGFLIKNADSIYINCTSVDYLKGAKCTNGNNRFINFHAWLSNASLFSGSTCISINTYANITVDGITCDTVETVFETLNNYARFSAVNVQCLNNSSVIDSSWTLLKLFGTVNDISVSGAFATTSNTHLKIFDDTFYTTYATNTIINSGRYNINISTLYIDNYYITDDKKFISTLNGSNNSSVSDLNVTYNGLVEYGKTATNNPDSTNTYGGSILTLGIYRSFAIQFAFSNTGSNTVIYARLKTHNTWMNWRQLSN